MQENGSGVDLDKARSAIDEADRGIAMLFARRMEAVAQVAAYKAKRGLPVLDAERERQMLARESQYVDEEIRPYFTRLLETTLAVSRQYQHRLMEGMRVAYCGTEGAFSWVATRRTFPDAEAVGCGSFQRVFEVVEDGICDCGVVPIENSTAGEVSQVMDLLFNGSLFVYQVFDVPVSQNLLGVPGASIGDIRKVVSHPQALSQCAAYIDEREWEAEESANTSFAALAVLEGGDRSVAAIGSAEVAALYGLVVLDHDINADMQNATRFAVIARSGGVRAADRFMLTFTVRNEAGSLAKAINVIGDHGFNMRSLRSRPMRSLAWCYYFFVEAEGDIASENGVAMLAELEEQCDRLRVLGSYVDSNEARGASWRPGE